MRHKLAVAEVSWLVEPESESHGQCRSLRPEQPRAGEITFTSDAGEETAVVFGAPSEIALQHVRLVRAIGAPVADGLLDLSTLGIWHKHPAQISYSSNAARQQRDAVLSSWASGILYRSDKNVGGGLRTPQIGALHAIAAHWSVSQKPGIIVMPTGTGKTEVMVATALAAQCRTVLVVVPSDALRTQAAGKFQTLGVLRAIGVVPSHFLYPVVGTLRRVPKEDGDLEVFDCCNVIVATMSALSGANPAILDKIAARCSHLFLDEAHHTPANTWNDLRERFSERAVLQFTATPFRRDGRRMEGRVLYNYPLVKAQAEDYFRAIRFEQVWAWDEESADEEIASVALERLREDLAAGLDHCVMARANTVERAKMLFETIYSQHAEFHPVVIHNKTTGRRKLLEEIKAGRHRVIVCVDMLGEGFDLPQLKIAALHDAHRSLGVTLQFAGRFTRTGSGIGAATVVANLADRRMAESLEELYSEDADWNRLLPDLSYEAIRPQVQLSEFVGGLQSSIPEGETEILSAAAIEPKTSTVVYEAEHYRPDAFRKAIPKDAELIVWWKNPEQNVVVFILRRFEELDWARTKDVTQRIYDLYVVFHDEATKLLFIHCSIKGSHGSLAKAVGGNVTQVCGERMFRVLSGIERLVFYNCGLLRTKGGAVRFQMFAGLDVEKAIDPAAQQDATKSNLFGSGYEEGDRITIGCSQKGTVWAHETSSIPDWMEWCRHLGKKLVNRSLGKDAFLAHTLVPKQIDVLPSEKPLCVEWPGFIFERIKKGFNLSRDGAKASWLDCDLELSAWTATDFDFTVGFPDGTKTTLRGALSSDRRLAVTEVPATATYVKSADLEQSLAVFFEEHPPILRFESGSELSGNRLVEPRSPRVHDFPLDSLSTKTWAGVNIERESKWKNGTERLDSVQHFVIAELLADPSFTIVIDDDDSGEAADVIAIRDTGQRIEVHFFHCKYSGAATSGSRADDLYVVCGQAVKGIMWTQDFKRLVEHVIHRERKTLNGRKTRFERGDLKALCSMQRTGKKALPEYTMTVVQPGVSKAAFKPEHSAILGSTSFFLRQRLNTSLLVWVSK